MIYIYLTTNGTVTHFNSISSNILYNAMHINEIISIYQVPLQNIDENSIKLLSNPDDIHLYIYFDCHFVGSIPYLYVHQIIIKFRINIHSEK